MVVEYAYKHDRTEQGEINCMDQSMTLHEAVPTELDQEERRQQILRPRVPSEESTSSHVRDRVCCHCHAVKWRLLGALRCAHPHFDSSRHFGIAATIRRCRQRLSWQ